MQVREELSGKAGLSQFSRYVECSVPDADSFEFSAVGFKVDHIMVIRARMTPAAMVPVTTRWDDFVSVLVLLSGRTTVVSGPDEYTLDVGRAMFDTGWGRRESRHDEPVDFVLVLIPAKIAHARGIRPDGRAVIRGSAALLPAIRALVRLVTPLATGDAARAVGSVRPIEAAILELISGVYFDTPTDAAEPYRVSALREQAVAVIHRDYRDSRTSASTVAARLSVSVRSLHRSFESSGTSVAVEIRRLRCDHAERALAAAVGMAKVDLDAISAAAGFPATVDLRRAISARHSMTVKDYRRTLADVSLQTVAL